MYRQMRNAECEILDTYKEERNTSGKPRPQISLSVEAQRLNGVIRYRVDAVVMAHVYLSKREILPQSMVASPQALSETATDSVLS